MHLGAFPLWICRIIIVLCECWSKFSCVFLFCFAGIHFPIGIKEATFGNAELFHHGAIDRLEMDPSNLTLNLQMFCDFEQNILRRFNTFSTFGVKFNWLSRNFPGHCRNGILLNVALSTFPKIGLHHVYRKPFFWCVFFVFIWDSIVLSCRERESWREDELNQSLELDKRIWEILILPPAPI